MPAPRRGRWRHHYNIGLVVVGAALAIALYLTSNLIWASVLIFLILVIMVLPLLFPSLRRRG